MDPSYDNYNSSISLFELHEAKEMVDSLIDKFGDQHEYVYDLAHNGQEALDMFKACFDKNNFCGNPNCSKRVYKLIVMDIQMPVMDGIAASRKILDFERTHGRQDQVKIVALTAQQDERTINGCKSVGMSKVYNKPARPHDIKEMVFLNVFGLSQDRWDLYKKVEEKILLSSR